MKKEIINVIAVCILNVAILYTLFSLVSSLF